MIAFLFKFRPSFEIPSILDLLVFFSKTKRRVFRICADFGDKNDFFPISFHPSQRPEEEEEKKIKIWPFQFPNLKDGNMNAPIIIIIINDVYDKQKENWTVDKLTNGRFGDSYRLP